MRRDVGTTRDRAGTMRGPGTEVWMVLLAVFACDDGAEETDVDAAAYREPIPATGTIRTPGTLCELVADIASGPGIECEALLYCCNVDTVTCWWESDEGQQWICDPFDDDCAAARVEAQCAVCEDANGFLYCE